MRRTFMVAAVVLALAWTARPQAQAPNFSGTWTYDQAKSGRGTGGNNPQVAFPTDMVIKQDGASFDLETSSSRQDVIKMAYKLDGTEVSFPGPSGTTIKAKAKMDGDKLVIDSKRSFTSPAGEITNDIKEVYSLSGGTITVTKTLATFGVENTGTAVYTRVSAP